MNTKLSAAVHGVLLAAFGAPFAAHAQQSSPADPGAPVPALVYVSVFQAAARPADPDQTPDKVWRAANDALVAAPDHGAAQPVEQAHGQHAPSAPAAPQPARKAAPQPAAGHANHHH